MNYYRKTVNNTANDVKLKMQIGDLTVKITENINKINDLLEVDKNIKKDIINNSNSIENMNNDITNNFNRISINDKNIKYQTGVINSNIDEIIHEYKNLKANAGDNLKDNLNHINLFYIKLSDNYSVIKIELILSVIDNITKTVVCKLYNFLNSNFLCIRYLKKNF